MKNTKEIQIGDGKGYKCKYWARKINLLLAVQERRPEFEPQN